jgi:hypothetical protein
MKVGFTQGHNPAHVRLHHIPVIVPLESSVDIYRRDVAFAASDA